MGVPYVCGKKSDMMFIEYNSLSQDGSCVSEAEPCSTDSSSASSVCVPKGQRERLCPIVDIQLLTQEEAATLEGY